MKDIYEKELEKIKILDKDSLEEFVNKFGKKHYNEKIRDIYEKDPEYITWIYGLNDNFFAGNEKYFERKSSLVAMKTYYEIVDFLKKQAR